MSRGAWYERACGLLCYSGLQGESEVWKAKWTCTSDYKIADEYWDWGRDSKGKAEGADGKDFKASL